MKVPVVAFGLLLMGTTPLDLGRASGLNQRGAAEGLENRYVRVTGTPDRESAPIMRPTRAINSASGCTPFSEAASVLCMMMNRTSTPLSMAGQTGLRRGCGGPPKRR